MPDNPICGSPAGVNFIGHFHLVQLLLPAMKAQSNPARIVSVTCKAEIDGCESLCPARAPLIRCCKSPCTRACHQSLDVHGCSFSLLPPTRIRSQSVLTLLRD